jgi:AAA domain
MRRQLRAWTRAEPIVDALVTEIRRLEIDSLIVDPFVSCHRMPENDNGAIDAVAKIFAQIADETNCAIELVHHVRKPSGASTEFTIDDARGASALINAARSARILNIMSKEEAEAAGVDEGQRRAYFRVDNGKANLAPPMEKAKWLKFVSVPLANGTEELALGDSIGVVTAWQMPSAFDGMTTADLLRVQKTIDAGEWREDVRSADWAGKAVAEVLGLDLSEPKTRVNIKTMLQTWIRNGALKISIRIAANRHERKFVEVGKWMV